MPVKEINWSELFVADIFFIQQACNKHDYLFRVQL